MWKVGDRLSHRMNRELGLGRVVATEGRTVQVEFPQSGTSLRLASDSPALAPVTLEVGCRVRRASTGETSRIARIEANGRITLTSGALAEGDDLWPLDLDETLLERLARGDVDPVPDFENRLHASRLLALREASGLGSFLGGRIRLFPHQLHVATNASATDPVRWLLADEVGLGKTVEACLILNRLLHTGRVNRCLVVAPATLTVQWLGELWRKYHRVFVLLDDKRLSDVAHDFGPEMNPFDVHRQAIVSMETLIARPRLTAQAAEAGIDLLVVDEAHRLRRPLHHPGEAAYRAVAPLAALGRHILLLSATPFEDDAHGFFRLLQLLRPEELPESDFAEHVARVRSLPPCTSATRREDIGGLPPRVPRPVEIPSAHEVEEALRALPGTDALALRRRTDRMKRALSSGAALAAVLSAAEEKLRGLASAQDRQDPRITHLARELVRWKADGEKTLIFVQWRETLDLVREALGRLTQLATAVFHEDLSPARRDIEVARFRDQDGPSVLVSTECGGEGRNFEFCHRIVLFDLPWNPSTVEQRIGRLDRIGRRFPVDIVYFRPASGLGAEAVRLMESTRVFLEPIAGLERDLEGVEGLLEAAAAGETRRSAEEILLTTAEEARERVRNAVQNELHRDRYRPDQAEEILSRVPADLDERTERAIVAAAERLGLFIERGRGPRVYSVEFGSTALVDSLPGIPGDASFLGTFDREEAVRNETLDFFAFGHPLVEGLLAEVEEGSRGRVALLRLALSDASADVGLLAAYREEGHLDVVVVDRSGRRRDDWREALLSAPLEAAAAAAVMKGESWSDLVHQLHQHLGDRVPEALAMLLVEPRHHVSE